MDADIACLRKFAHEKSEDAFREFVRRRIDFVYATALRQVGGDAHLAQEVAHNVFIDLARKARALASRPNLTGWLYTSTRFAAAKALRARMRRFKHETEAQAMNEILAGNPAREIAWDDLRPVIDAAMHELGEQDREAILLRYFEGRALAEVGAAIGLTENSARMRIERALDKLRARLARRGIVSTAAALGATLGAQPAVTAPAGLVAAAAGAALDGLAFAGASAWLPALGRLLASPKVAAVALTSVASLVLHVTGSARLDARVAAEAARQNEIIAALRSANAGLREENRQMASAEGARDNLPRAATPAADPLDRLRAIAALLKEGYVRVQWNSGLGFSGDLLTPSLRKLFALSTAEAESLTAHLVRAEREIGALALAQAKVQRSAREIVIDVPAIPAARESYARLCDALRATLGAERYALMQDIGLGGALEARLGQGGLQPAVMQVWHVANPRLPAHPYALERPATWPPPPRPAGASLPAGMRGPEHHPGAMDLAALKQNLGPFAALVPEDF